MIRSLIGGKVSFIKHKQEDERFHYSDIPTDEYIERFGFLSFSCSKGTRMYKFTFRGVQDSYLTAPIMYLKDGHKFQVPNEILKCKSK